MASYNCIYSDCEGIEITTVIYSEQPECVVFEIEYYNETEMNISTYHKIDDMQRLHDELGELLVKARQTELNNLLTRGK
jgi:uncharacterized protein YkuJ